MAILINTNKTKHTPYNKTEDAKSHKTYIMYAVRWTVTTGVPRQKLALPKRQFFQPLPEKVWKLLLQVILKHKGFFFFKWTWSAACRTGTFLLPIFIIYQCSRFFNNLFNNNNNNNKTLFRRISLLFDLMFFSCLILLSPFLCVQVSSFIIQLLVLNRWFSSCFAPCTPSHHIRMSVPFFPLFSHPPNKKTKKPKKIATPRLRFW